MKTYLLSVLICCGIITGTSAVTLDTAKIDQITGLKGKMNEKEGVYKVTFPRNDVKVVVDGWAMPPFMGLNETDIIVFDSTGVAVEDAAAATVVYEKALMAGIGNYFEFAA